MKEKKQAPDHRDFSFTKNSKFLPVVEHYELFESLFDDRCPITRCKILAENCKDKLKDSNIRLSETKTGIVSKMNVKTADG